MNRTLILILAVFLFFAHPTEAAQTGTKLKDICGANGENRHAGSPQLEQLCQGAYINGNLWTINDNNSRVRASIAVVCAYSCLSGGMSSCGGDGGGACSEASNSGYKAYDYSNSSDANLDSAKKNGASAIAYQGSNVKTLANGKNPSSNASSGASGGSGGANSLPASCQRASSGGSVQDRFACAQETDTSLPAFARSPQFMEDFQKITGTSLQSVINKSGETIVNDYSMAALQNAYGTLDGKMSFSDFLKNGSKLVGGILGNLGSKEEQGKFLTQVLPAPLRGMIPGVTPLAVPDRGGDTSASMVAASGAAGPGSGQSVASSNDANSILGAKVHAGNETAYRSPANRGVGNDPEYNPLISLFKRVTMQYQRSDVFNERVQLGKWK